MDFALLDKHHKVIEDLVGRRGRGHGLGERRIKLSCISRRDNHGLRVTSSLFPVGLGGGGSGNGGSTPLSSGGRIINKGMANSNRWNSEHSEQLTETQKFIKTCTAATITTSCHPHHENDDDEKKRNHMIDFTIACFNHDVQNHQRIVDHHDVLLVSTSILLPRAPSFPNHAHDPTSR